MAEEIYRSSKWLNFVVKDVKAPFTTTLGAGKTPDMRQLLGVLARLPETTKENMQGCNPNTFVLIELRNEFFSVPEHQALYGWARPLWNGVIFLYGYDNYYRHRIDFVVERWQTKPWITALDMIPRKRMAQVAWIMATLKMRPDLTKGDTQLASIHTLIELQEEFFQYENNPGRTAAFKFIWKSGITLYKESEYCRYPVDWALERWKTKTWQPREAYRPRAHCWREWDNLSKEERLKMQQGMGRS